MIPGHCRGNGWVAWHSKNRYVSFDTPSCSATSLWRSSRSIRRFRRWSPNVLGFNG
jgi:predicted RNA-binding Zn-ribbon protein involved in translation (DUF1610 family)